MVATTLSGTYRVPEYIVVLSRREKVHIMDTWWVPTARRVGQVGRGGGATAVAAAAAKVCRCGCGCWCCRYSCCSKVSAGALCCTYLERGKRAEIDVWAGKQVPPPRLRDGLPCQTRTQQTDTHARTPSPFQSETNLSLAKVHEDY